MNKKIGLALGSGGVRGLAHIGIIKIIIENKIPISCISGSSAGALIGAYFAVHGEIKSLEKLLIKNKSEFLPLFIDFGLRGGLVNGNKIDAFLEKILNNASFEDTKIPLYIVATDLISGQPSIIKTGSIAKAVRGSISVPIVFKPISYNEQLLVDGGLSDPVPVGTLKENGAEKVIAVNLYHKNEFVDRKFNLSNIALRSTRIALHNLSKIAVKNADVIINPDTSACIDKTSITNYFDAENIKKLISIGEKEALNLLPQIKKITK